MVCARRCAGRPIGNVDFLSGLDMRRKQSLFPQKRWPKSKVRE